MQDLVAPGFELDVAGDVLDGQHVAGHPFPAVAAGQHGHHLNAQQLPAAQGRDEVRHCALAGGEALPNDILGMLDLTLLENREDRATQPDQCAAGNRRRPLGQRLELQPCAVVVEEDAAVQIAHHDSLRQLGHEGGQPVLLLLDGGLGRSDLRIDVIHQRITLLGQVIGGTRQLLDLGRPFDADPEIAVGAKHQAQRLRHAQQTLDILLEQPVEHAHADGKTEDRHHGADRQAGQQELGQHRPLLVLHVQPDEQRRDTERAGHQQPEDDDGEEKTLFCLHGGFRSEFVPARQSTAPGEWIRRPAFP